MVSKNPIDLVAPIRTLLPEALHDIGVDLDLDGLPARPECPSNSFIGLLEWNGLREIPIGPLRVVGIAKVDRSLVRGLAGG